MGGMGGSLNPCVLHLQKMELELECPACLNFLNEPMLLPCDHICCSSCIANLTDYGMKCPSCQLSFLRQGIKRPSDNIRRLRNTSIKDKTQEAENVSGQNLFNTRSSNVGGDICTEQGEPDSTSSFIDIKDSNNHYQDLDFCYRECPSKRKLGNDVTAKREPELPLQEENNLIINKRNDPGKPYDKTMSASCPTKEYSVNEQKRQKLDPELAKQVAESSLHSKRNDDNHGLRNGDFLSNCHSDSELKDQEFRSVPCLTTLDATAVAKCVFCQSSCESEASGPMLDFSKGKSIDCYQATRSNVLHVHKKCIEWTPLVYYVGDIVKNLDVEVSRAAKIKCSKCGNKGAALGCYIKSCRKSFHVPCAIETSKCRWDCDNFLLLCPAHFSRKFPSDRCKTEKKVKSTDSLATKLENPEFLRDIHPMKDTVRDLWTAKPDITKQWVLCGSALSAIESDLLENFAKTIGAVVTKNWKQQVTHVIVSTDELGACSRTVKFLKAILGGKWILTLDWIKECMKVLHPVAEENYEITHDIHGFCYGPKKGRIRVMEKAPQLFSGLSFCFTGPFESSYKGLLEDLITVAGGTITKENDPLNNETKGSFPTTFVICSPLAPSECKPADHPEVIRRVDEAVVHASRTGSQVIPQSWILDSIAACELQPVDC